MELVTEKPLECYFEKIKGKKVNTLIIASPFITGPGMSYISEYVKRRKIQVHVLTNLSEFNLLRSLQNPINPLLNLWEQLGNRLEIRSSTKLHAKLFLADESVALHGSSNLTLGGAESNHELNMLVIGRSEQVKKHMRSLREWFNTLWDEATLLDKNMLFEIERRWLSINKKFLGNFEEMVPEYKLAGQQWDKIKTLTRKPHHIDKALEILSRQGAVDEGKEIARPANAMRKLLFLEEQGIVKREKNKIVPLQKISRPEEIVRILSETIPCYQAVVNILRKNRMVNYQDLYNQLGTSESDQINATVRWLEDLGFVQREKKGRRPDIFSWNEIDPLPSAKPSFP